MTVTTVSCFLGCQNREFSDCICACTFAVEIILVLLLVVICPICPYCGICGPYCYLAMPRRLAMCCHFSLSNFFFLFLCLTLFGFGFQEGILRRLKQNRTKNYVAAVIPSMSPSCFKVFHQSFLCAPPASHFCSHFLLLNISGPISSSVFSIKMEGQSWFCIYKL